MLNPTTTPNTFAHFERVVPVVVVVVVVTCGCEAL